MVQLKSIGRCRRGAALIVTGVLLGGIAACGSSSGGTSTTASGGGGHGQCSDIPSGPINVANILPLTGPTSTSGIPAKDATDVAVSYFNAHDSICGHKISLTDYNDKGDPATALNFAREIVSQGNVVVFNDSYSSPQNLIHPYFMQHHIPLINPDGANALINTAQNPTAFSIAPSNAQYADLMVNWAKSQGDNNIGILSDGTSFSQELATDVQADVKAAGLKLSTTITYSPTAIDLTTPLTQAKEAGAQTLLPTGFTGITAMISGLKQMGWAPHVIGWGNLHSYGVTAAEAPPGTVDGCSVYFVKGQSTSALLTPLNLALLNGMQAKIGTNPATATVVEAYFQLIALKHAVETANSLDGTKLAAALEATSNLPTNLPYITLNWKADPSAHFAWPASAMKMCSLTSGAYDIPTTVS
jgi:ABC-type branched-subunit amino acid transport system substrate-binding protein